MGSKSSPPPAPDYRAAAQETAAGNLEAARLATKANRVDTYTPYGNLEYTSGVNGDPDQWRADINLSPVGKQLLDYQDRASLGLGDLTTGAMGRVGQSLANPFDFASVGDVQKAAEQSIFGRLEPKLAQDREALRTQLINSGFRIGTEAYDRAMERADQQANDARQQAVMAGINTMPQTFQMASALRNQPLNELSALRTGSQVTNPTFQHAPQQQTTTGANMLGAAQSQGQYDMNAYNQRVGQQNALMGGLFSLGGAMAGMPAGQSLPKIFGF